jgi:hypothetical protein
VWRPGIGALRPDTGKALPWNPTHDRGNGVGVIAAYPGGILVGSDTVHAGFEYHARLCGFPLLSRPHSRGSPTSVRQNRD